STPQVIRKRLSYFDRPRKQPICASPCKAPGTESCSPSNRSIGNSQSYSHQERKIHNERKNVPRDIVDVFEPAGRAGAAIRTKLHHRRSVDATGQLSGMDLPELWARDDLRSCGIRRERSSGSTL